MSTEPFFSKLTIENPKRHADVATENRLFAYYAGYSSAFTTKLLDSTNLERDTVWDCPGSADTAYGCPVAFKLIRANLS